MDQPPPLVSISALVLLGLGLWACIAAWGVAWQRRQAGLSVLPFQPRRQVPWQGIDLAMILSVYVTTVIAVSVLAALWLGPEAGKPLQAIDKPDVSHIIVRLFGQGDAWTVALCVIAAAIIAPVVEEVLFRLFLQGWLESVDRRLGRLLPWLRRRIPWGVWPVAATSFVFALPHFRVEAPQFAPEFLRFIMVGNAVAGLVTAAFAIALARWFRHATAADLGVNWKEFLPDVGLGLVTFGAVAAPVYLGQILLIQIFPSYLAPDPFILFPFALVLGAIYCRTHRIVPSIVVHAALNTTSLLMLWLTGPGVAG
jgi:membrane protease YdiL (CAAX protease family)